MVTVKPKCKIHQVVSPLIKPYFWQSATNKQIIDGQKDKLTMRTNIHVALCSKEAKSHVSETRKFSTFGHANIS